MQKTLFSEPIEAAEFSKMHVWELNAWHSIYTDRASPKVEQILNQVKKLPMSERAIFKQLKPYVKWEYQ